MFVTWKEDQDHWRGCVSYKKLKQLRKDNFSRVVLVDIDANDILSAEDISVKGMGRCDCNSAFVFLPADEYIQQVLSFLSNV